SPPDRRPPADRPRPHRLRPAARRARAGRRDRRAHRKEHPVSTENVTADNVSSPPPVGAASDDAALREAMHRVRLEVDKAVIGQAGTVTGLLVSLLARGHVLLEGVPGVAKTLVVRAFARALGLDTKRVQFTPDLMPGDVTGPLIYDARTRQVEIRHGPVFTHILLADEINRTPPKTQAALLEAMEERQISADGVTRPLPDPFLVAATQNPIEHEGTYSLPEAQLDRFMMKLVVGMPERDAEVSVLRLHAGGFSPRALTGVEATVTAEEIRAAQDAAAPVEVT